MGFDCPGCGSLRAVNLLTNGDVAGAASSNLLLVVALPLLVLWWALAALRAARGEPAPWTLGLGRGPLRVLAVVALVVVVAFGLARNLPGLGDWAVWLAS